MAIMKVLVIFACVVAAFASEPGYEGSKSVEYSSESVNSDGNNKLLYRGMYYDSEGCGEDGFYYKNEYTFMMCSNGNAYEQRCAPGSKNSGHKSYATGADYYIHDFCDVNMVNDGYNGVAPSHPIKPVPHAPKPAGYEVKQVTVEKKQYVETPNQIHKVNYNGMYSGKCSADGFYYNDQQSFVMCSNGNAYVQRCAPGSRNSGQNRYQHGDAYYYNDFCDVNLVDYGYNAPGNSFYGPHYYPSPKFFHPVPAGYYYH